MVRDHPNSTQPYLRNPEIILWSKRGQDNSSYRGSRTLSNPPNLSHLDNVDPSPPSLACSCLQSMAIPLHRPAPFPISKSFQTPLLRDPTLSSPHRRHLLRCRMLLWPGPAQAAPRRRSSLRSFVRPRHRPSVSRLGLRTFPRQG